MNRSLPIVAALLAGVVFLTSANNALGAVINYTNLGTYNTAVGAHTIITFQGFSDGTILTNQFLGQGVTFDGSDTITSGSSFPSDGKGDAGNGRIELLFSSYQTHIGAEFPGALTIQIFDGATLVGTSQNFGGSGVGFFGGITSDIPFNRAILSDWVDNFVFIDNLHFGSQAVPEPASVTIFGLMAAGGAFYGWRRRKQVVVA